MKPIRSATAISLPANFKNAWNAKRVRNGKTTKDHASGSHASRFANRAARVAWQQDKGGRSAFPGKAA